MSEFVLTGGYAVDYRARKAMVKGFNQTTDINTIINNKYAGPNSYSPIGFLYYIITGKHNPTVEELEFFDVNNILNNTTAINDLKNIKPGDIYFLGDNSFNRLRIVQDISYINYTTHKFKTMDYIVPNSTYSYSLGENYITVNSSALYLIENKKYMKIDEVANALNLEIAPEPIPALGDIGFTHRENYENIASAIRERGEFTDTYYPSEMSQAILDIPHDEVVDPTPYNQTIDALNRNLNFTEINSTTMPSLITEKAIHYGLFYGTKNIESIEIPQDLDVFIIRQLSLCAAFNPSVNTIDFGEVPIALEGTCLAHNNHLYNIKMNLKEVYPHLFNFTEIYEKEGVFESTGNSNLKLVLTNETRPIVDIGGPWDINWLGLTEDDKIYVVPNLVDGYKTYGPWAHYADQIYPITDEILALFD